MRKIEYIFIDSDRETRDGKPGRHAVPNLGHHYVINSAGAVLKLIDVCQPGSFMPKPTCGEEDLNRCSIGIKYNGSLEPGTLNLELRAKLIELLAELRSQWPSAKILGVSEIGFGTLNFEPGTRGVIRPSDAMNQIRRTLSDLP